MKLIAEFRTEKNTKFSDKPNEDRLLVDCENGIFIIVDGVSRDLENGLYPNPSPSLQVSKIFIKHAYNYLTSNLKKTNDYLQLINKAFLVGNEAIHDFNQSYAGDFLPGTVGIIVIIKDNNVYYGYIGDCFGALITGGNKKIFTRCQTKMIHAHMKEYSAFQIRNEICNHLRHPYAYGVLDGRKGALDFIVTGNFILHENDRLLLFTDGLAEIVDELDNNQLLQMSADKIFNYKNDKNTDDKTLIIVRLFKDENNR